MVGGGCGLSRETEEVLFGLMIWTIYAMGVYEMGIVFLWY